MGTSVAAAYVQDLYEEIRRACKALEDIGHNSLVVVASKDSIVQIGSEKGIWFLEKNYDCIRDFYNYCRDDHLIKQEEQSKMAYGAASLKTSQQPATLPKQATARAPVYKVKTESAAQKRTAAAKSSASRVVSASHTVTVTAKTHTDYNMSDEETTSSMLDNVDSETERKKTTVVKGNIIPKNDIVVIEHETLQKGLMDMIEKRKMFVPSTAVHLTSPKITNISLNKSSITVGSGGASSLTRPTVQSQFPRKTFDCDSCDKKYLRLEDLTVHKRKHTGETPYPCSMCEKRFRSRGLLRAHWAVHSATKSYVCDICGQLFARQTNLKRHKAVHSDKHPYVCDTCGKGFKDASTFKMHQMIHTGLRPYCCETCGKSFYRLYSLNIHKRIHTGEMPYECETCGHFFRQSKNLNTHKKRQHNLAR